MRGRRQRLDIFGRDGYYTMCMKKISTDERFALERAVIDDYIKYEGAKVIADDGEGYIAVKPGHTAKCLFADASESLSAIRSNGKIEGEFCVLGVSPDNVPAFFDGHPRYRTYTYTAPLPPELDGAVKISRLAPTLAPVVFEYYDNDACYGLDDVRALMRDKAVFGAIVDGKLAGFIGMHDDGNMGLLTVLEEYRRRGIGEALEKFLINYVMSFGRTPICDVFEENAPSIALQQKLGLVVSPYYTLWSEL